MEETKKNYEIVQSFQVSKCHRSANEVAQDLGHIFIERVFFMKSSCAILSVSIPVSTEGNAYDGAAQ